MFSRDRAQMREVFFRAWRHYRQNLPLGGIEKIVVDVALRHPEYHSILESASRHQDRDFSPETGRANPFLHLGMHIAIEEQLSVDRPAGIRQRFAQLVADTGDAHEAQHVMMECLGETLWQAQRNGTAPKEEDYLACLEKAACAGR